MADAQETSLETLEERLGHRFTEPNWLVRALTHGSARDGSRGGDRISYQRLEFLGDRVLGLVIAQALFARLPEADEGQLAKRLNQLVRAETLADVAAEIDLGPFMILGDSEIQSGGRQKKALLADVCEAVIAALYLDGGLDVARAFILAHWDARLEDDSLTLKDAKTSLQEWGHARGFGVPRYVTVNRDGPDHEPVFTVEVEVGSMTPEQASGSSKRDAQQNAAEAFLRREGVWSNHS